MPNLPHEVVIPHPGGWTYALDPRFEWCKQNCKGAYQGRMLMLNQTVWRFQSVKDATLFALKWS